MTEVVASFAGAVVVYLILVCIGQIAGALIRIANVLERLEKRTADKP